MTKHNKSEEKETALVKKQKTFPAPKGMSNSVHGNLMAMAKDSITESSYIKPVDKGSGFHYKDLIVPKLLNVEVKAIDIYWAKYMGTPGQPFHEVPITEPRPSDDHKRRARIASNLSGEEATLSLPPSATRAFSGFYENLVKNNIPVIGTRLNIDSRLAYRASDGKPYNQVTFSLANPNDADPEIVAAEWLDEEDDESAA